MPFAASHRPASEPLTAGLGGKVGSPVVGITIVASPTHLGVVVVGKAHQLPEYTLLGVQLGCTFHPGMNSPQPQSASLLRLPICLPSVYTLSLLLIWVSPES